MDDNTENFLRKFIYSPKRLAFFYFALIVIFAFVYYILGADHYDGLIPTKPIESGFWLFYSDLTKFTYYSIVTITTLGYGEIKPATELGMAICGTESLLGIIVLGLFLNAVSRRKGIDDERVKYKKSISYTKNRAIGIYEKFVLIDIYYLKNFVLARICNVSNPDPNNNRDLFRYNVKYQDLEKIFEVVLDTRFPLYSPIIEAYYVYLDGYIRSLKDLADALDMEEFFELKKMILKHISELYIYTAKHGIKDDMQRFRVDGEYKKNVLEAINNFEANEDIILPSHLTTKYGLLKKQLNGLISFFSTLDEEINKIRKN